MVSHMNHPMFDIFRSLDFVAEVIRLTFDAAVTLLFYELFKPVSRGLSLAATSFTLIFVAIMAVNSLNYFAPVVLLGGATP
jgi:Domain of unknown function (DUF4386)